MTDLVDLAGSSLDEGTNSLLVQAKGSALSEDGSDATDYGDVPFMCSLGVTARPFPADENGTAQGIIADDLPGIDGVCIGGRDTRTTKVFGNLSPGDTALHSTGPEEAAQVLCKEKDRQVAAVSKDSAGKNMIILMDGKNDKITISGFGQLIEMTREGISIAERGGSGMLFQNGVAYVLGTVVLGGLTPFAPVHSGIGVGVTSIPTPGVFVGV